MAVTVATAANALRLAPPNVALPSAMVDVLTQHLQAAREAVEEYAPAAPTAAKDEAIIRFVARLYDELGSQSRSANPFYISGAAAVLSRYRERRAKVAEAG